MDDIITAFDCYFINTSNLIDVMHVYKGCKW